MSYEVYVDVMNHNVADAGEWPDGRPKQVVEHYKGDTPDLSDIPQDRLDVLTELGAIGPPGQGPVVAAATVATTPSAEEEPKPTAGVAKKT